MANLKARTLSQIAIGTHIDLTYAKSDSQLDQICGVVTDSDFAESFEITDGSNSSITLDFQMVRVFRQTKLTDIIKDIAVGTRIRYSYGGSEDRMPDREGTIQQNDSEQSVLVRLDSGEEECIDYSVLQSLLVIETPAVKSDTPITGEKFCPAEHVNQQIQPEELDRPEIHLNYSDAAIKETFDGLSGAEKGRFTSAYDLFKQALKTNNRVQIQQSIAKVRSILQQMVRPSGVATRFCARMLRRADEYDHKLFLAGGYFEEAAKACFCQYLYILSGAYAALALKNGQCDSVEEMFDILCYSTVKADDVTGIRYLYENTGDQYMTQLDQMIDRLFRVKGLKSHKALTRSARLDRLLEKYPLCSMKDEIEKFDNGKDSSQNQDGRSAAPATSDKKEKEPDLPLIRPRITDIGMISLLSPDSQTGEITNEYGSVYDFWFDDISDKVLRRVIEGCTIANPNSVGYRVHFQVTNDCAHEIELDSSYVDLARAVAADNTRPDVSEVAFEVCLSAFNTYDKNRAVFDIIKYALRLYKQKQDLEYIRTAVELYEKYAEYYPKEDAFAIVDVAHCYSILGKYDEMIALGATALSIPGNTAKQRIPLLSRYLKMIKNYYETSRDKALLEQLLHYIDTLKAEYSNNFTYDATVQNVYNSQLLALEIYAQCELEMLEEAQKSFAKLSDNNSQKQVLGDMIAELAAKHSHESEGDVVEPTVDVASADEVEEDDEDESDEIIVPYRDNDGWNALGLSKAEIIDYALNIQGDERVPAMLAYLRSAAMLNPEILPVYQTVAMAADDPMEPHDYDLDTVAKIMDSWDSDYDILNDCCMSVIVIMTAFMHSRSDNYNLSAYWSSVSVKRDIPELEDLFDSLEQFCRTVGCSMGIYAHMQNGGTDALHGEMSATIARAGGLYVQYVLSPFNNKFKPLVKTRQRIFSKDSFLSQMLDLVRHNDREELLTRQGDFIRRYLKNAVRVSAEFINREAINTEIDENFACVIMGINNQKHKPGSEKLEGPRRTSLFNIIVDCLTIICRWYELSEQQEEIGLKNDANDQIYSKTCDIVRERLQKVRYSARQRIMNGTDAQSAAGLYLIAFAMTGLEARLKGSMDHKKYMYADFLRSNNILLDENFMPDLSSTFCALPGFNILHRIRQHIEAPKASYEEQVVRIFGIDKNANNYGTADRIMEYLHATREAVDVSIPRNAEEYYAQTEQQVNMRYREFQEDYALAMSYGRIMRTDDFCYNLRDTISYWFHRCKETQNYGFFVSLVQHAENMINNSAKNYQDRLTQELDAIIESTPSCFSEHPDYEDAIRTQITNQRFSVAEDWMTRIRLDDFSFTIERPEALDYLDGFLDRYANIYRQVQDLSRPLNTLVSPRTHTYKDTKGGQRLIESWLMNGGTAGEKKVAQIMSLLGWRDIVIERRSDVNGIELYECKRESAANRLITTSHPIAAFGSDLYNSDDNPIYVACLYGNYDCTRLCSKIHILDRVRGNKIILADTALGQADRRALARELKRSENGFNYIYLIVDRVLVAYLATHYREDQINCMLLAMGMPFSYAQPYVAESASPMPPEMFIGRKTELHNIRAERGGVNVIYGGRQLGKTALLKKAQSDVDGIDNQRAVWIDIKSKDCAQAARLISEKLVDLSITPGVEPTDSWDVLCRNISNRLRSTDETRISYLLLLLDEADVFINDCANLEFRPLVALKDVQTSFPGRFKYVLAGLKDIVRFNRNVALGNNAVITHMSSMKITPFNTPEAEELLMKPLSYLGFSLQDKVIVSQILSTCNYFPGLIQLYAKNLIRSVRAADYAGYSETQVPPYVVTEEHLRKTLTKREFTDEILRKYEMTLLLDDDYYTIALLLAFLYYTEPEKIPNGFTVHDLREVITDLGLEQLYGLNEELIEPLIYDLKDLNILRPVTEDSFLFASKNFRDLLGSSDAVTMKLEKKG